LGDQTQKVTEAVVQDEIITIYVICDDYLKAMNYRDNRQSVMSTALVAARLIKNCLADARKALQEEGYIPRMLSESRLNRRLYAIREGLW
jgi:hypothetical protein